MLTRNCPVCRSDSLESKHITYVQEYKGKVIIIENVPALVCSQCGEVIIEAGTAERIQQLVWQQPRTGRTVTVPLYDLAQSPA